MPRYQATSQLADIGLYPGPTAAAQRDDVGISRSEPLPSAAPQHDDVGTARAAPSPAVAPQHDAVDITRSGTAHVSPPSMPTLTPATTLAHPTR